MTGPALYPPRTDEQIATDVRRVLVWDTRVEASDITVEVYDRIATLSGSVPSYGARTAAANDAWTTAGVNAVENLLEVSLPVVPPPPGDDVLRSNAEKVLMWYAELDANQIRVNVTDGVVTLHGTVPTHWEKTQAEQIVGGLAGVRRVRDELAVTPTERPADEAVADAVIAALDRNVLVDASRLDVVVEDGVVTLNGSVTSGAQHRVAYDAASRTAGVADVKDHLVVSVE
ncbi:MAG: BON domain-containing protein [Planctomycetota bacterium]